MTRRSVNTRCPSLGVDLHDLVAGAVVVQIVHLFMPSGQQARNCRHAQLPALAHKQLPLVHWRRRPNSTIAVAPPLDTAVAASARGATAPGARRARGPGRRARVVGEPGGQLALDAADGEAGPARIQSLPQLVLKRRPPAWGARNLRGGGGGGGGGVPLCLARQGGQAAPCLDGSVRGVSDRFGVGRDHTGAECQMPPPRPPFTPPGQPPVDSQAGAVAPCSAVAACPYPGTLRLDPSRYLRPGPSHHYRRRPPRRRTSLHSWAS
jgi:hypothetical protein